MASPHGYYPSYQNDSGNRVIAVDEFGEDDERFVEISDLLDDSPNDLCNKSMMMMVSCDSSRQQIRRGSRHFRAFFLGLAAVLGTFMLAGTFSMRGSSTQLRSFPQPLGLSATVDKKIKEMSQQKVLYSALSEEEKSHLFRQFILDHGKKYNDVADEEARLELFKASLEVIDTLNMANPFALYGITKYADYSEVEKQHMKARSDYSDYEGMKLGLPNTLLDSAPLGKQTVVQAEGVSRADSEGAGGFYTNLAADSGEVAWGTASDCAACTTFPELAEYTSIKSLPTQFDWRARGAVTSVKNQKYCGSCWSFSTAGDIEGTTFLATGTLTDLSEQQLVACDDNKGYTEGCNGGYPYAAMSYVVKIGGLVYEADYPYKGLCAWDSCNQNLYYGAPVCDKAVLNACLKTKQVSAIQGWQMVALGKDYEEFMKLYMVKNGPLSISINSEGMEYYVHGITGCPSEQFPEYCQAGAIERYFPKYDTMKCDPDYLDHAVLLVAYGQDDDGLPYWTIKNSWDTTWGEDGYYRIISGHNYCGVANMAVHSVFKKMDSETADDDYRRAKAADAKP